MQDGHSNDCYNLSGHLLRQLRLGGNSCTDAITLLVITNCEFVSFACSLQWWPWHNLASVSMRPHYAARGRSHATQLPMICTYKHGQQEFMLPGTMPQHLMSGNASSCFAFLLHMMTVILLVKSYV